MMYSLTPTGVTSIDPLTSPLKVTIRNEVHKGHHVIDAQGRYLEQPIPTSTPWFTGTNQEGR